MICSVLLLQIRCTNPTRGYVLVYDGTSGKNKVKVRMLCSFSLGPKCLQRRGVGGGVFRHI